MFPRKTFALEETERQPCLAHFNMDRHPRVQIALYSVSIAGPFDSGTGRPTRPAVAVSSSVSRSRADSPDGEDACARQIVSTVARRAFSARSPTRDIEAPLRFYKEARAKAASRPGSRWRSARSSPAPSSCSASSAIPRRRAAVALPRQRCRTGLAPVVLPLEQRARRGTARSRDRGQTQSPGDAGAAGEADAGRSARPTRSSPTSRASGCICGISPPRVRTRGRSPTSTTTCVRRSGARRSCSSTASCAKTAARSICCARTTPSSTSGWRKHYGIPERVRQPLQAGVAR